MVAKHIRLKLIQIEWILNFKSSNQPIFDQKSLIWRDKKWKFEFFDAIKNSKKVLLFTPAWTAKHLKIW